MSTKAMAAAQLGNGAMQFWVILPEGNVSTMWKTSSEPTAPWSALTNFPLPGGSQASYIAASAGAEGLLQLWIVDQNGNIWTTYTTPTGWSAWAPFFPSSTQYATMAAGQLSNGAMQFFVTDTAGNLWTSWQNNPAPSAEEEWPREQSGVSPSSGWASLRQVGLPSTVDQALTLAAHIGAGGLLQLWMTDSHRNMWTQWSTPTGWAPWQKFFYGPSSNYYSMAVAQLSNGAMQFFTINSSLNLYTTWKLSSAPDAPWNTPLERVAFPVAAEAVAASNGAGGVLQVFVMDYASDVWTSWSSAAGTAWSPWQSFVTT